MREEKELVGGAINTTGEAMAIIRAIKDKIPTEPHPEGLLIPRKLWKKIKKSGLLTPLISADNK